MAYDYLKPKAKSPDKMREKRNGQFRNAPAFNEGIGGFTSARKLPEGASKNMRLESGPTARRGKLI